MGEDNRELASGCPVCAAGHIPASLPSSFLNDHGHLMAVHFATAPPPFKVITAINAIKTLFSPQGASTRRFLLAAETTALLQRVFFPEGTETH